MLQTPTNSSSNINLRSKGLNLVSGKLHKGCVKDAATKLSIGSIPSTYQSIIYKTQSKKAFGTSQQRFYKKDKIQHQKIIDSHQPSFTQTETTKSSIQNNNTYNVAGYGPFISKSKRQWMRTIKTPGPGTYYRKNNDNQQTKPKRKCITRQQNIRRKFINIQRKDEITLEEEVNRKQNMSPGPGQYDLEDIQNWKKANKGWKSAFETKVKRDKYIPNSITPGPDVYASTFKKVKKNKKQIQKKQGQKLFKNNHKLIIDIIQQQKDQIPGPGAYKHEMPDFKPFYQKIKLSRNFMEPLHQKKSKINSPTSTKYNIKRIYDDMSPKLIQSAVFMSECQRKPFQATTQHQADYQQSASQKKPNFHFNIRNQWI